MSQGWQFIFVMLPIVGLILSVPIAATDKDICCGYHFAGRILAGALIGFMIACTIYGLCSLIEQLAS